MKRTFKKLCQSEHPHIVQEPQRILLSGLSGISSEAQGMATGVEASAFSVQQPLVQNLSISKLPKKLQVTIKA